jgi:spore germination cell wall hydrolase CwlJ-like protein
VGSLGINDASLEAGVSYVPEGLGKAVAAIAVVLLMWMEHGGQEPREGEIVRIITEQSLAIVTIMQEAAGEPYAGKVAVAEVIRNRMNKKYASDGTVSGTVLRPKQFSGWNSSDAGRIRSVRIDNEDKVVQECYRAWEVAQAGSDTVHGAVLYYNPSVVKDVPEWAMPHSATEVAVVGQHHFFIPKVRTSTEV